MKGIIIYSDKWLNFWTRRSGNKIKIKAMSIFPFIIVPNNYKANPVLNNINHERIHLTQQFECLFIPYAIMYYGHWLVNIIKYKLKKEKDWVNKSYLDIVFEKEAYANEKNLDYLKTRKFYSWWFVK